MPCSLPCIKARVPPLQGKSVRQRETADAWAPSLCRKGTCPLQIISHHIEVVPNLCLILSNALKSKELISAWKAVALPLSYTRIGRIPFALWRASVKNAATGFHAKPAPAFATRSRFGRVLRSGPFDFGTHRHCAFSGGRASPRWRRRSSGRDAPNSGGCTRRHLPESEVRGRTAPSPFGLRRGSLRLLRPKSGPACRAVRSRSERRLVGEAGLEPAKAKPADLQSAPFASRDTPPVAPGT